mmetsp:Transcript_96841/g.202341  ORF Transcript_96841/g.202341 Transcript_96841/m.202341 type:complete len:845 (-) Transcript_96841:678-3212(-)
MAVDGSEEVVKALTAILKNKELLYKQAETLKDWCSQRFTTDRWLDENEREWYALDRACRSRPWATRKDEAFKYPFREATNQMRAVEGAWVGDDQKTVEFTRGDAPCDVIVQVHMVPHCHADHRVLLFTPEFGSHTSFDMESWGFIEPDEQVDLWVVSWQGWTDFDTMIPQVVRRVLSFGDGVNTVWFGQGAGAIVAYEVLRRIEGLQTPNFPIALLVSDCPAPEEFQEAYKPYTHADFPQLLENPDISDEHRSRVAGDVATMATYAYKHGDARGVGVPIIAFGHEDDTFVPAERMQAWEAYSGKNDFEYVDLGEAQDLEDYVQGQRYTMNADPTVLETLTATLQKYDRWIEDGKFPDIGDVNAPLPEEVDVIVVGAGIAGIYQANELAGSGLNVLCLDRYHEIGGVWNYYGNDYSKVNTSEIGYRIVDRSGKGLRPNEDHSPRRDIMRDIYVVASQHSKGKIRCNIEVLSVDRREDDRFDVKTRNVKTNEEKTLIARGVTFQVNRRIGEKRIVDWPGSEKFRGDIFYGYGNAMKGVSYHGKKVLVVGAGAFAFENVRTAVELGARHVTLLGRRDGTTCPKWIDMLAFLRPLDQHLMTHRSGNMISFETWQNCYKEAGLRMPKCWEEGLLKPNNHTISVSDLAFIAGFHGMFKLECGEIDHFKEDGLGVELKDGSIIDCDMIVKCTGFLLNDEVPKVTGLQKMQPYGLIERNLNYFAEPLLDGGQFGGGKDKAAVELDFGDITPEQYAKGLEVLKTLSIGFKEAYVSPSGNPFGSGQGGPIVYLSEYFTYMMNHQEEQEALLKMSGKPPQDVVNLWASQIAEYQHLIMTRLIAALGKMAMAKEAN